MIKKTSLFAILLFTSILQENGGILRILPSESTSYVDVAPTANRLLFFWSDKRNPHEVHPAHRTRYVRVLLYSHGLHWNPWADPEVGKSGLSLPPQGKLILVHVCLLIPYCLFMCGSRKIRRGGSGPDNVVVVVVVVVVIVVVVVVVRTQLVQLLFVLELQRKHIVTCDFRANPDSLPLDPLMLFVLKVTNQGGE